MDGKIPVMLSNCAGVQYCRPARIANVGCGDIQWKGERERSRQRTRTSPARRLGSKSHRSPSKDRARSAPPNADRSRSCSPERPWKGPGMSSRVVRMYIRGRPITMIAPMDSGEIKENQSTPKRRLELDWVYGYNGRSCRANLRQLASGEVVYFIAAVAVLYSPTEKTQRHYMGHTDDITCLDIHPDGVTVVSGQVGGHRRDMELPHYAKLDPYFNTQYDRDNWYKSRVCIWDSRTLHTITVIGAGQLAFGPRAVSFSIADGGAQLAIANENGSGTMLRLWDWKKKHTIAEAKATTDPLFLTAFNPKDNTQLVTAGKGHVTFWTLKKNGLLSRKNGIFGKLKPKYVECISFLDNGDVITGDSKGNILIFKKDSSQAGRTIIGAHKEGVTALYVRRDGTLMSGGGDKKIVLWDLDLQKPLKISKLPKKTGKVRSICVLESGSGTADSNISVGTTGNCLCEGKIGEDFRLTTQGHHSELLIVATHPSQPVFVTTDDVNCVILWNASLRQVVWRTTLKPAVISPQYPAHSADFHPRGQLIAVGSTCGRWFVLDATTGDVIIKRKHASEQLDCLKYSPSGELLAVGSHDNCIYVYTVSDNGRAYQKRGTLRGHSSYVTHLDWDVGSRFLQSTSGDYELLYWDVTALRHVSHASSMSDVTWATQTCVFGYSVFGMWPEDADGTDINACAASNDRTMLASSDDFGKVNLYRYPCSSPMSTGQIYPGHSSHVTCVRFLYDDSYLLSTGGADCAVFQWRVVGKGAKLDKSARGQSSTDKGISKLTFINDLLDDTPRNGENQEEASSVRETLLRSPDNDKNSARTRRRNNSTNESHASAREPEVTPKLLANDQALIDYIFAMN
ncbi:echinoderm microtubule-associated protein-like 2 isoform X2 [Branchiostoma floridae x Branchiostoma belcheri]